MVKIEQLDTRTYKISNEAHTFIVRPMKSGAYRWGMFSEGDEGDDALVADDALTSKEIIGIAVITLMN